MNEQNQANSQEIADLPHGAHAISQLPQEKQQEFRKKFPKFWVHPRISEILVLLDGSTAADRVAQETYEWSRAAGIEPGATSPLSISGPSMTAFSKWWQENRMHRATSLVHVTGQELLEPDLVVDHNASTRHNESLEIMDAVIAKFKKQLTGPGSISLQAALQAVQLRDALSKDDKKVVVMMDATTEECMMELLEIVNSVCSTDQRRLIAEKVKGSPLLRRLNAKKEETRVEGVLVEDE